MTAETPESSPVSQTEHLIVPDPNDGDRAGNGEFWISLGAFLQSYGKLIPRAASDLRTTAEQLEPLWRRLVGKDQSQGKLAEQIQAVHAHVEALRARITELPTRSAHDPVDDAMQEVFQDKLVERVTTTIQAELRTIHKAIEAIKNAAAVRDEAESNRRALHDQSGEIQAVRKECEAARLEAARAREELRTTSMSLSQSKAESAILAKEIDQLKGESTQWRQAVLGQELAADDSCRSVCDELVAAAMRRDCPALGLLGTLMAFHVATADRLSTMLKDLGEAYYAWRPRSHTGPAGDDPMESALIRFLVGRCEKQGVRNKIEVVRPGMRFNGEKHRSESGGGTGVAEVRGWIVTREGGQALHRANVVAR
jgi:hypothetical protein